MKVFVCTSVCDRFYMCKKHSLRYKFKVQEDWEVTTLNRNIANYSMYCTTTFLCLYMAY
jgi:hypothetical protein